MSKRRNRKHSKIDGLDPALKETVEQMLLTGSTYSEIVVYLKENQIEISVASICRYARSFQANLEALQIAQENFRQIVDVVDKYPNLDTTEAISRIASQNVLNALASADQEAWNNISIDKLVRESTALIRAAAYKKRIETQNQDSMETGLDAVKSLMFEAMAKEQPELYKQVSVFLEAKKAEGL